VPHPQNHMKNSSAPTQRRATRLPPITIVTKPEEPMEFALEKFGIWRPWSALHSAKPVNAPSLDSHGQELT
jgi:hypothetical protein